MAGAFRPMSFCSSTSHHGLNTAPDGDFFNSCKNSRSDLADMVPTKLQRGCDAGNPARIAKIDAAVTTQPELRGAAIARRGRSSQTRLRSACESRWLSRVGRSTMAARAEEKRVAH